MKKLVSLMLALCMLCGAIAFASEITESSEEQSAQMQLSLELAGGYTVVIPTELSFGEPIDLEETDENTVDHVYYKAEATLSVTKNKIEQDQLVIYTESANVWNLSNGADTIGYRYELGTEAEGCAVGEGNEMMVNRNNTGDFQLVFKTDSAPVDGFPAGTFTDTLTFSVALEG